MEEFWEWFCSIPGLYRIHREILLQCFGDPEEVWKATDAELQILQNRGCRWIAKLTAFRQKMSPRDCAALRREKGVRFVSCEQQEYPLRLKSLRDYPYGLFYVGELPEEQIRTVAIVGARMCTPGGKGTAERLAREVIHAGGAVVSGGAYGIDGAAGWAALQEGGKSYALFGCGPDIYYPSSNRALFDEMKDNGGLISEFPCGVRPLSSHFPMRNRLISGLSDVVVVVEAKEKSGSLITADFALDQGKQVLAVPGRPDDVLSRGCNELISQGAGIILSAESFTESVFPDFKIKKFPLSANPALAPAEKLVYSKFGFHAVSLWELEENTALSLSELSDSLLSLEMKGLIRETEQNFYVKVK